MRISPAKLLIVVAFGIVILVELRTVLAFFGIEVAIPTALAIGISVILLVVLWATFPLIKSSVAG